MECLNPPLSEVPVDEWFCPACAPLGSAAAGMGLVVPTQRAGDANHVLFEEIPNLWFELF